MIFELIGLEDNNVAINADDIRGLVEVELQYLNCTDDSHNHPQKGCRVLIRDVSNYVYVKDAFYILLDKWKQYINGVN